MHRNRPHPSSAVEGYYSKFDLQNGAHIVVIICTIRAARDSNRANMVSFTYQPADGTEIWQRQYYDKTIRMRRIPNASDPFAFNLQVPGIGFMRCESDGSVEYDLDFNDFRFHAKIHEEVNWSGRKDKPGRESSPEGWLSMLPIPLHWHVSSLRSRGTCELHLASKAIPQSMAVSSSEGGDVLVHSEKNWGNSFPKSHMWVQGREGDRYICLAGGIVTTGVKAYLVGYRSPDLNIDFRPPLSMQLLGLSPFLSSQSDWDQGTFHLDVRSFTVRLVIHATAPRNSFFTLGAPFPEGHRENALGESLRAAVEVTVYKRPFIFMRWQQVGRERFERASLEFGGAHFGGLEDKTS